MTTGANILSKREREVAGNIALGRTRKEVSSELYISPATAITHTKNIYEKTGSHNLADITRHTVAKALGKSIEEVEDAIRSYIHGQLVKMILACFFLSLQVYIIWIDSQDLARSRTVKIARKAKNTKRAARLKDTYYA